MKCAFSGPHPQSLPFICSDEDPSYDNLMQRLIKSVVELCAHGVREYYCGMALGIDLLCGEIVVSLKDSYPDIKLHAIIPFRGQENGWNDEDKERYTNLLKQCDSELCQHEEHKNEYYLERNCYMVDNADILLAVCDPNNIPMRSGTGATVRYAKSKNKHIIFVPPAL